MATARRTTLGALSASTLNARASLGPTRVEKKPAKRLTMMGPAPAAGRASVGGDRLSMAGRRKSSMGGRRQSMAPQKLQDPRPINDKAFITNEIRLLIQYLTEHGYDHAISPKLLTAPSAKEFAHIVEFLICQIDPNFKFGAKFEEEYPHVMKQLKYPFNISKSYLASVGSPHSWPPLLASIHWLVELLLFAESGGINRMAMDPEANMVNADMMENGSLSDKVLFEYLAQSYELWIGGADEESIDADLERRFSAQAENVTATNSMLEGEIEELEAELESLRAQQSPLVVLTQKKKDMVSDLSKFETLIESLTSHVNERKQRLDELQRNLGRKEEEHGLMVQQQAELNEALAKQVMSAADVARLHNERTTLKTAIGTHETRLDEVRKQSWDRECDIAKGVENLQAQLAALSEAMKRCSAPVFSVTLQVASASLSELFQVAPPHSSNGANSTAPLTLSSVRASLASYKSQLHDEARKVQRDILRVQSEVDVCSEKRTECTRSAHAEEGKLRALEDSIVKLKAELQAASEEAEADANALRMEVESIRLGKDADLARMQKESTRVTLALRELSMQQEAAKEEAHDIILLALDVLTTHKAHIQSELASLEETATALHEDILEMGQATVAVDNAPVAV